MYSCSLGWLQANPVFYVFQKHFIKGVSEISLIKIFTKCNPMVLTGQGVDNNSCSCIMSLRGAAMACLKLPNAKRSI